MVIWAANQSTSHLSPFLYSQNRRMKLKKELRAVREINDKAKTTEEGKEEKSEPAEVEEQAAEVGSSDDTATATCGTAATSPPPANT